MRVGGSICSSLPEPESSGEQALFACATHLFLQTPDSSRAHEALGRALGPGNLERLKLFLAFVRTAHYWTKLHPELTFEDDVIQLLSTHESVAHCILKDPEAQMDGLVGQVAAELASLRTLHKQHEIISQAYGELRVDHQYLTHSLHKTEENLRELTLAMRAQEEMLARLGVSPTISTICWPVSLLPRNSPWVRVRRVRYPRKNS
jgi:hypothetical protein